MVILAPINWFLSASDWCTESYLNNTSNGFSLPIHCIFSDGWSFEFFKFERSPNPSFLRGNFPGDPIRFQSGLDVPDLKKLDTPLPFITQLRCICEVIFDVMQSAYIAGSKAHYKQVEDREAKQSYTRPHFDKCDQTLQSVEDTLRACRMAEARCKAGDIHDVDMTALLSLQDRYEICSSAHLVHCSYSVSVQGQCWRPAEITLSWRTGTMGRLARHEFVPFSRYCCSGWNLISFKIINASGLLRSVDFHLQSSAKSYRGQGKRKEGPIRSIRELGGHLYTRRWQETIYKRRMTWR